MPLEAVEYSRDGAGGVGNSVAASGWRFAKKRSTIAAISWRLTFGVWVALALTTGALGRTPAGTATVCAAAAGRLLATGRVSNATRLMSIRCKGDTLSEVTLPPHDPQPSVIEGGNAVENPMAPCVVGVLTVTREAGISPP